MNQNEQDEERKESGLDAIMQLRHQQHELNYTMKLLVRHALAQGCTWRTIGAALGTSGQAAWEQYRSTSPNKLLHEARPNPVE